MPGANVWGQYGQFMNDPAAQVAAHFSQTAFKQGQEYVEQNVGSLPFFCQFAIFVCF